MKLLLLALLVCACASPAALGSGGTAVAQVGSAPAGMSAGDVQVRVLPYGPTASPEPPSPAVTAPAPTQLAKPTLRPVGQIAPPVVVAKGVITWQPGTALWASPGAIVRGWHVGHVRVCAGSRCVDVLLDGWCACGERHGSPTLLDLSAAAFARLAPLSQGVVHVEVIGQ
jgi:hypothetical protein